MLNITFPLSSNLLHSFLKKNSLSEKAFGSLIFSSRNLLLSDLSSTVYFPLSRSLLAEPYPVMDLIICKDKIYRLINRIVLGFLYKGSSGIPFRQKLWL